MSKAQSRSCDPACQEMLKRAESCGMETAWDRFDEQQPSCGFGTLGTCCRLCLQGPCRIDPFGEGAQRGVCGARDYSIVARNLIRYIGGGTAAHSDHGRHIGLTLLAMTQGHAPDYGIKDPDKAARVAAKLGIPTAGRKPIEVAGDVARAALEDFSRQSEEPCSFLTANITAGRKEKFSECAVTPTNIDRAIAEIMHRSTPGVDADPVDLIFGGLKCGLADYTGCHLSTDLTDILFGTPRPVQSEANLGVIDPEKVNICVHGHTPILSEVVVDVARSMEEEARAAGSKGINIVGICCTSNEVLMRKGVPVATNFLAQELAIMTGAIDAMVVDFQCIMPAVQTVAECFHTRIITTMPIAKIPAAYHMDFREEHARDSARKIVEIAIEAYKNRDPGKVFVPQVKCKVTAGFSVEAMFDVFGKVSPTNPVKALTDAIRKGQLRGVCLFAGCNTTKVPHDAAHLTIAKELAARDVFLVATGCAAGAFAKAGLLTGDAVDMYAGKGLKSFIRGLDERSGLAVRLPLVFHMGSCVDNSRAIDLAVAMANEMGCDISEIPFVASAPEAMSEKAVSIGSWVITLGIPTHVGVIPPVYGSALVTEVATKIAEDVFGGYFILDTDPVRSAGKLVAALDDRNWKMSFAGTEAGESAAS